MDHDSNPDRAIADRLVAQASRLDLGAPMLEVVIERGRQRQQRRRTTVGVMAVVGVCAATIISINVLSRPADHGRTVTTPVADNSVPTNDGPNTGSSSPVNVVPSDLVWNRVDPDSAEAVSMFSGYSGAPRIAGDGPFVAWSTAPGSPTGSENDYVPVLWRSEDGQSWQQVPDLQLGRLASVAERDGRFFAYGTTPAESASSGTKSDLAIATSDDGGVTWATQHLPIDTSGLTDDPMISSVSVSANAIAAGPNGVLAIARLMVGLDVDKLPATAGTYGYNITSTGIVINQPFGCDVTVPTTTGPPPAATDMGEPPTTTVECALSNAVPSSTVSSDFVSSDTAVANTERVDATSTSITSTVSTVVGSNTTLPQIATTSLTWAELGLSDTAIDALKSQLHVYFSADGVSFNEVQAPPTGDSPTSWDARLTAIDGGFVAQIMTYAAVDGSNELFQTIDGQSWTDIGPALISNPDSFGSMGDRLVMSGTSPGSLNPGTSAIAVRDPDGTWTTVNLNNLTLPSDGVKTTLGSNGMVVSPTGITLLATLFVDPVAEVGGIDIARDGITMHADDYGGNFTFIDESGTELGRIANYGTTSALVDIDRKTGNFVVRRTDGGEVAATFTNQEFYDSVSSTSSNPLPTMFVLRSADGVNWSRESLSDLAGADVYGSGGIRLTDSQIIVAANLSGETNANGTPKQVLLVGTPKA